MREVEIQISPSAQPAHVETAIESACAAEGLQIGMKSTLARFPSSVHWHFRKPGRRGALEITLSPRETRLWASIQDGRRAEWIEPCLANIKKEVERMMKEGARAAS